MKYVLNLIVVLVLVSTFGFSSHAAGAENEDYISEWGYIEGVQGPGARGEGLHDVQLNATSSSKRTHLTMHCDKEHYVLVFDLPQLLESDRSSAASTFDYISKNGIHGVGIETASGEKQVYFFAEYSRTPDNSKYQLIVDINSKKPFSGNVTRQKHNKKEFAKFFDIASNNDHFGLSYYAWFPNSSETSETEPKQILYEIFLTPRDSFTKNFERFQDRCNKSW